MSGHTPGPWAVGMRGGANASGVFARDGVDMPDYPAKYSDTSICTVCGLWSNAWLKDLEADKRNAVGLANARLIAAAPDLLHHLRILAAEDSQCESDWVKKKEAARAAIARAEKGSL